jgi:hypothetical protein
MKSFDSHFAHNQQPPRSIFKSDFQKKKKKDLNLNSEHAISNTIKSTAALLLCWKALQHKLQH